jgi:uncharacterized protein YggT (Ycf19 family)
MALSLLILQTLILVAGLSLVAQLLVGAFNWARRQDNFVYQLLGVVTRPVVRLVRIVTPRLIIDSHVPLVAFLLLFIGYFAVGFWHRDVCMDNVTANGCERWAQHWQQGKQ